MKGREYYRHLQNAISSSAFVLDSQVSYTEIDVNECYVRGVLTFANGYELHIAEYVITEPTILRTKYRYHLQNQASDLIARWDNAPHHRAVGTFPHHLHLDDGSIHSSSAMDIATVLAAVISYLE